MSELCSLLDYVEYWALTKPDNIAFVDNEREMSYRELYDSIKNFQATFQSSEIGFGNVILLQSEKSCKFIAAFLALSGLGVKVACIPSKIAYDMYVMYCDTINPDAVIVISNFEIFDYVAIQTSAIKIQSLTKSQNIIELTVCEASNFSLINKENLAKTYYNITSGSSGKIKIAPFYSWQIVENAKSVNCIFPLSEGSSIFVAFLPYIHPHELMRNIVFGALSVLWDNSILLNIEKYIQKFNIQQMVAFPAIYKMLLRNKKNISNIKTCLVCGEKITYDIKMDFLKLNGISIIPVWGSTETCGIAFYTPQEKLLDEKSIIGKPLPGYRVRVDENNGEMQLKSLCCASAYTDNAYAMCTDDGYVKTGDVVVINDGYYYYDGRIDDIVKISGKKLSLSCLEDFLNVKYKHIHTANIDEDKNIIINCNYVNTDEDNLIKTVKKYVFDLISSSVEVRVVLGGDEEISFSGKYKKSRKRLNNENC